MIAIDGEQLPAALMNEQPLISEFAIHYQKFTPQVWTAMEDVYKICPQNMKKALLALCCAEHPRLGINSPARYLSQETLELVATHVSDYDFCYLPEEKIVNEPSETEHKIPADNGDDQ